MKMRKLAGLLMLLLLVVIYSFGAMLIAVHLLPESRMAEFVYYPVVGILWIFPAMKIVKWMQPAEDN